MQRGIEGDLTIKALSIQQPWAWAILCAGKDIENRVWNTKYRGPLLIHTGKTYGRYGQYIEETMEICIPDNLPTGGIIGMAGLTDCVTSSDSRWFYGPYGFVLANPEPLPFIRYKGRLGIFEVDLDNIPFIPSIKRGVGVCKK